RAVGMGAGRRGCRAGGGRGSEGDWRGRRGGRGGGGGASARPLPTTFGMAPTDLWPARVLGPADLGRAMELSAAAGWNQVNADWRVFLGLGHLMGVDVTGDGVVGTAAALPLGRDFGWVSMVLLGASFPRRR